MRHHSIAAPQHMQHSSFEDLKQFLSSHEDRLDNILEKTMDVVIIIIAACLIYMVVQTLYILNHAHHVYTAEIACLMCNAIQGLLYNAMQGFM